MKNVICPVCGQVNSEKSAQCRKCNNALTKDPWYIRVNLFKRLKRVEIANKKNQVAIMKIAQNLELFDQ